METFFSYGFFTLFGFIIGVSVSIFLLLQYFSISEEPNKDNEEIDELPFPFVLLENGDKIPVQQININEASKQSIPTDGLFLHTNFIEYNSYKKALFQKMQECEMHEQYEIGAKIRDLHNNLNSWFELRKQWFIDCVGKKLRPSEMECNCEKCNLLVQNGAIVINQDMAMRMFSDENRRKLEGKDFKFILVE